jgi:predicted HTH domain antitoxin
MSRPTTPVDLPTELVDLLGSPEAAAVKAREALVLDLLRRSAISQGRAAALLGLTRWDVLDLMARYEIESGPETAEELRAELDDVRRFLPDS